MVTTAIAPSDVDLQECSDWAEWDRFVSENPNGTIFHTSVWRKVLEKHGFVPLYLVARSGAGDILFAYPFSLIPILGGLANVAVSLPRSDVGGPLFNHGMSAAALADPLLRKMRRKALGKRIVSYSTSLLDPEAYSALSKNGTNGSKGVNFLLNLQEAPTERIWTSIFTKRDNQRKDIRRIERDGIQTRMASEADLPAFHELYSHTINRAGGVPYPLVFLRDVWAALYPKNFNLLLLKDGEKVVAGSGFLCDPDKGVVYMTYGAYSTETSTRDSLYLYSFWKVLLWAEEHGYKMVNFGATADDPSDGNYRFKNQFGAKIVKRYVVRQIVLPAQLDNFARAILGKRLS